jgi:hypothetical protein
MIPAALSLTLTSSSISLVKKIIRDNINSVTPFFWSRIFVRVQWTYLVFYPHLDIELRSLKFPSLSYQVCANHIDWYKQLFSQVQIHRVGNHCKKCLLLPVKASILSFKMTMHLFSWDIYKCDHRCIYCGPEDAWGSTQPWEKVGARPSHTAWGSSTIIAPYQALATLLHARGQ